MSKSKVAAPLSQQLAIAAMPKAFPYRTMQDSQGSLAEGSSHRITAVIEIDGVISRGESSEQSASASPLQIALLALLARGVDSRSLAAKRRAALKLVNKAAEAGSSVEAYLTKHDAQYAALVKDVKAQAAAELPPVAKKGPITFRGESRVSSAKVSAA